MANKTLSIEYYKTDKEMRDLIQSFQELLDTRYKVSSDSIRSLCQAQSTSQIDDISNHDDAGDKQDDTKPLLHVAQIHNEAEQVLPFVDNPSCAIIPDITFGAGHDEAVKQITLSIEKLFSSDPSSSKDLGDSTNDTNIKQQVIEKTSASEGDNKRVVAPHLCTVAWNKSPKRYQECIAIVRTVDYDNEPVLQGGAEIKGTFSWSRYDKQYCKVVDNENGSYNITYSACSVRFHMLFVTVNGCEVAGSPFLVDVDDDDSWE